MQSSKWRCHQRVPFVVSGERPHRLGPPDSSLLDFAGRGEYSALGHRPVCRGGKTIGSACVSDDSMLSMALHLRDQEMSRRDIATRLVITTDAKKGQYPSPATVMRMLREHDEQAA
ncbi:hypothetical protein [Streptomyces sp. NPDC049881]|uniref:hypothetical protein n=1 Tax=Streptomyces sp. NPDC049881 TaxID=3155778 RepID=UPI003444A17A